MDKMVAHQWIVNHILVDTQQTEMTVRDQVRTLDMQDHRITVQELANEMGVSIGSVHSILTGSVGSDNLAAPSR